VSHGRRIAASQEQDSAARIYQKGPPPFIRTILQSENPISVVLLAFDEPAILLCFIVERLGESEKY